MPDQAQQQQCVCHYSPASCKIHTIADYQAQQQQGGAASVCPCGHRITEHMRQGRGVCSYYDCPCRFAPRELVSDHLAEENARLTQRIAELEQERDADESISAFAADEWAADSALITLLRAQLADSERQWEQMRVVVEAARREEQRHLRDVDSHTGGMPAEKQAWYRQAHTAGCDLAGVLALNNAALDASASQQAGENTQS